MSEENQAAKEGAEKELPEVNPEKESEEEKTEPEVRKAQPTEHKGINSIAKQVSAKVAVIAVAALFVGILIGQFALPAGTTGLISLPGEGGEETVDMDAVKAKVEAYLNENILGPQGVEGEILSIEPYNDEFYTMKVNITRDGESLAVDDIFLSKSGNAISGTVTFLDEEVEPVQVNPTTQPQPTNVPKSDRPTVELFIMSYCPYGLQAQKALLPAWELLGEKADISVKFVDYIMHDWKEIEENNVQYCIQKEEPEKYVEFAKCFVQSDDSAGCRASAGVNEAKLEACIAAADEEFGITAAYEDQASWASGRFPQYNVHTALNDEYGVQGSPTWVINGTALSVSRNPEAVKQAICNAFNEQPAECDQTLSTAQASAGIGGGTGSGSPEAECA